MDFVPKYLDDLERDRATAAELTGKPTHPLLTRLSMDSLGNAKGKDSKLDHHRPDW